MRGALGIWNRFDRSTSIFGKCEIRRCKAIYSIKRNKSTHNKCRPESGLVAASTANENDLSTFTMYAQAFNVHEHTESKMNASNVRFQSCRFAGQRSHFAAWASKILIIFLFFHFIYLFSFGVLSASFGFYAHTYTSHEHISDRVRFTFHEMN